MSVTRMRMSEEADDCVSGISTNLGERAIVPDVAVVGETVAHEAQLSTLDVLLDRVEGLLLRDLHLRIRPARDLDDHV